MSKGGVARVALGVVLGALLAGTTAVAAHARVEIATDPPPTRSFDAGVHDYALRCDGDPVAVTVGAGSDVEVQIAGRQVGSGSATRTVAADPGQAIVVALRRPGRSRRYHFRCVPPAFPRWDFTRHRRPVHAYYAITPQPGLGVEDAEPIGNHVVLLDRRGVPVWWTSTSKPPFDAKVLPGGRIAYAPADGENAVFHSKGYRIQELDGTVRRVVRVVGSTTDPHDLQRLPNGNFLVLSYKPRAGVDLSAYGGETSETVLDGLIQEIDRRGRVVWQWNSKDYIGLDETGRWFESGVFGNPERDIVHINSVEPVGSRALLISLRHTDAVYKIDRATGKVRWKLGGTPTPESLEVRRDPYGSNPLAGQHDPRLTRNGTITVFDNGTGLDGRAPRAVRYRIRPRAGVARLVGQVEDPGASVSPCCGSARRDREGSWLISWGGVPLISELDPRGRRTFELEFPDRAFSYRGVGAPAGALRIRDIRRGMNEMYGRP